MISLTAAKAVNAVIDVVAIVRHSFFAEHDRSAVVQALEDYQRAMVNGDETAFLDAVIRFVKERTHGADHQEAAAPRRKRAKSICRQL